MDLKKTILRTVLFGLLTEAERIANEQADIGSSIPSAYAT